MTVEFDVLPAAPTGVLNMRLPLPSPRLYEVDPGANYLAMRLPSASLDTPYWIGHLQLQLPSISSLLSDAAGGHLYMQLPELQGALSGVDTTPNVAILQFRLPSAWLQGNGIQNDRGVLSMELPPLDFFLASEEGGHLYMRLPTADTYLRDTEGPENYGVLIQSPGYAFGFGALSLSSIADSLVLNDSVSGYVIKILEDTLLLNDMLPSTLTAQMSMEDGLVLSDLLAAAWSVTFSDSIAFGDTLTSRKQALERLIDTLVLSGAMTNQLAALAAIADWMALGDSIINFDAELMADSVALSDTLSKRLQTINTLLDSILLGDTLTNTAQTVAVMADSISLDDMLTSSAQLFSYMTDGIVFQCRLRIGGQLYVGYVCNTALKAFTEYADVPYNSMCVMNGTTYAAGAAGIYRIGGDERDGEPVRMTLRSGLTNFGTGKLKRLPNIYIGYTASGQVVAKVIITSERGAKSEYWYEMVEIPADVTRENRVPVGKGLKSVYWQWELVTTGSASFDTIALHPLILDRRI